MEENEPVSRIEPCRLEQIPEALGDVIADLKAEATQLGNRLAPSTARALASLVRAMNTYYSNRIEGHKTSLREIERAMKNDFDEDRRDLQMEARAHMRVQAEIESKFARSDLEPPTSVAFIRWLHGEFYRDLPEDLRIIRAKDGRHLLMAPGTFRSPEQDLPGQKTGVGRHDPPSSHRVEAFMSYFEERYRLDTMGSSQRIIAMAAAHHRLNFIHPFYDGNGRVSRLMSHAIGLAAGIGAHGLWSVSRGLARGLASPDEYRAKMEQADLTRRNALDGRGNLSQETLVDFVHWFLSVCLDQVRFMGGLFDLDHLRDRLRLFTASQGLRPESVGILDEVVIRGEMPRGDASRASGLPERTARDVLAALVASGVLASETPKGPVSLRFPAHVAEIVFPRLYAEAA